MGVRCTLMGHTYGDSEVEREREERGDEAVVTIREIQVCERCGTRSVVSENKEVTSVASGAEEAPPEREPEPVAADVAEDADADPAAHDPETDDAVILDDDDDEEAQEPEPEPGERQYGEWPDADSDHATAEGDPVATGEDTTAPAWPDAEGDDEGFDASTPDGEAGEAPGLADAERPDAADDEPTVPAEAVVPDEEDAEFVGAGGADADASGDDVQTGSASPSDGGIDREGAAPSPAAPSTEGTELHCPSCDYRDDSTDGSLRQGDICPECKRGYLAARE